MKDQIKLAKSILESKGYTVTKKINEAPYVDYQEEEDTSPLASTVREFINLEKDYRKIPASELKKSYDKAGKLDAHNLEHIALAAACEAANLHDCTEVGDIYWLEALAKYIGTSTREVSRMLREYR